MSHNPFAINGVYEVLILWIVVSGRVTWWQLQMLCVCAFSVTNELQPHIELIERLVQIITLLFGAFSNKNSTECCCYVQTQHELKGKFVKGYFCMMQSSSSLNVVCNWKPVLSLLLCNLICLASKIKYIFECADRNWCFCF